MAGHVILSASTLTLGLKATKKQGRSWSVVLKSRKRQWKLKGTGRKD